MVSSIISCFFLKLGFNGEKLIWFVEIAEKEKTCLVMKCKILILEIECTRQGGTCNLDFVQESLDSFYDISMKIDLVHMILGQARCVTL